MNRGFSLVELSIVLVILGLLTGGILAGQSLIRASELRAVSADLMRYKTAHHTFRDKYFAMAGDLPVATRLWGRQTLTADCVSNSGLLVAGTPGSCDGNGDGLITTTGSGSISNDAFQFWRQLALAGLIEGTYPGTAGAAAGWVSNIGVNTPRSKISNAGYSVWWWTNYSGVAATYDGAYGNMMGFGADLAGNVSIGAALKAEEAWNIDTKMDDGKPGTGYIKVQTPAAAYMVNCATGTNSTAGTAEYQLTGTSIACALLYRFDS